MTTELVLGALLIFALRVANVGLDTLRILLITRDMKLFTWVIGFTETLLYVYILSTVLTDLENPLNMIAYAGGFATGNLVGMRVENMLAMGFKHVRVISRGYGPAIAKQLRKREYGVTELKGRGRDGKVTILSINVRRKHMNDLMARVSEIDPGAMMTSEEVTPLKRGYWR
jgi:uncharacterized protein YebE (UPF0316 family)